MDFLDSKITANVEAVDQLIDSFEDLARRYCKLLEDETAIDRSMFALECLVLLLRLYEGAMRLPDIEGDQGAPRISHEAWKTMFDSIGARMFGHDAYWTVIETLGPNPPDPVLGSLADDISDIWRDLKAGLLLIDSGGPNCRDGAVWAWRFGFENHWGRHAVEAISVLHSLCVDSSSRIDGA